MRKSVNSSHFFSSGIHVEEVVGHSDCPRKKYHSLPILQMEELNLTVNRIRSEETTAPLSFGVRRQSSNEAQDDVPVTE